MKPFDNKTIKFKGIFKFLNKIYFPYLFSILWTAVLLYLSLGRMPKAEGIKIPHLDKIVHFIMYFIYATILILEINKRNKKSTNLMIVLYAILFGILMEFLQAVLFPYRSAELADAISNSLGAIIAFLTYPWVKKIIIEP